MSIFIIQVEKYCNYFSSNTKMSLSNARMKVATHVLYLVPTSLFITGDYGLLWYRIQTKLILDEISNIPCVKKKKKKSSKVWGLLSLAKTNIFCFSFLDRISKVFTLVYANLILTSLETCNNVEVCWNPLATFELIFFLDTRYMY